VTLRYVLPLVLLFGAVACSSDGEGQGTTPDARGSTSSTAPAQSSTAPAQASTTSSDTTADPWTAEDPPSECASGLTIGYVPPGFAFVLNEFHETAIFHRFASGDDSVLAVGRQISPPPYSGVRREVTRDGREFTIVEETRMIRILEEVDDDIQIQVASDSLDAETLLQIAESVHYDPTRDWRN
jgi:hypothetical protein